MQTPTLSPSAGLWACLWVLLAVLSWAGLRRREDSQSGIAAGVAAVLKFYPAILIVALALRSRRAAAVAVLSSTACIVGSCWLFGASEWSAYARAIQDVAAGHIHAIANLRHYL